MKNRAQGMALITVLFILTIMTVSIAWLSEEMFLSLRSAENSRDKAQAWQLLTGSEAWALSVLARDAQDSDTDHPAESWNTLGQTVQVEHGDLATAIEDMQGRFNLNNLIDETLIKDSADTNKADARLWTQAFRQLLLALELNPELADAVLDWIDADQNVRGAYGAEDADYLNLTPPYRAANRAFSNVSELLMIKGFDPATVEKLLPYISAIPRSDVRININTAQPTLLRILGNKLLSVAESESLVAERPEEGYTAEEFLQHDMMAGEQNVATLLIDDSSRYFRVKSSAEFGRARVKMYSLVERKEGLASVIRRSPVL